MLKNGQNFGLKKRHILQLFVGIKRMYFILLALQHN